MPETDLYHPVKRHLEALGFEVKSEVKGCDVVARRGEEPPVIVELKKAMSLALLLQAVDRLAISDHVYVAVGRPKRGIAATMVKLCRRLGIGMMIVTAAGSVEVLADPVPYKPRQNARKRKMLLKEFSARQGDPNIGGSTRTPQMTAYRQDALKCARHLDAHGATRIRDVKSATAVDRASGILRDNVYGWFAKRERGIYDLTDQGRAALLRFRANPGEVA